MKRTAMMFAVIVLLAVAVSGSPVLAGTIITSTAQDGSAFFGFVPTAANLQLFTTQSNNPQTNPSNSLLSLGPGGDGLLCTASGNSFNCTASNFIPVAYSLPGAFTSRPDKVVSAYPDFGCGDGPGTFGVAGTGTLGCIETGAFNLTGGGTTTVSYDQFDRVNIGAHNTAPGTSSGTFSTPGTNCEGGVGVGCVEGELVGNMVSLVNLSQDGGASFAQLNGMPTGSISFTRLSAAGFSNAPHSMMLDQQINQNIDPQGPSLYTAVFSEHDFTGSAIGSYTQRNFLWNPAASTANVSEANVLAFYVGLGKNITGQSVGLRAELSTNQSTMGGEGTGSETIAYTLDWALNGSHPGGNFFTPGLNVRDWAGDVTTPTPNPPGDGAGFVN